MKKQILKAGLVGALFLFSFQSMAQTDLVVNYYNGTTQNFSITDNGKLYFDNDDLVILTGNANAVTIPISIIRKITFPLNQSLSVDDIVMDNSDLFIFPNPSNEYFKISSSSTQRMNVVIYSTNGNVVLSGECYANEPIQIGGLESGTYMVVINNKSFKLNKL